MEERRARRRSRGIRAPAAVAATGLLALTTAACPAASAERTFVSLAGDVDVVGTGEACGFAYADLNDFAPSPADPEATDRLLVSSAYTGTLGSLSYVTSPDALKPPPALPHSYTALAPGTIVAATLVLCVADVDDEPFGFVDDVLTIDGVEVPFAFDDVDQFVAGVAGFSGEVAFALEPTVFPLLEDGLVEVRIDEPGRTTSDPGSAEIFAIDHSRLEIRHDPCLSPTLGAATALRVAPGALVTWEAPPGATSDLLSGALLDLRVSRSLSGGTCLAANLDRPEHADGRPAPATGDGWWYVARACGPDEGGTDSFGALRDLPGCP